MRRLALFASILLGCATEGTTDVPDASLTDASRDASVDVRADVRPTDAATDGTTSDAAPDADAAADAGDDVVDAGVPCPDASTCTALQNPCASTCDCCNKQAICAKVGGLLVNWCCMPLGKACTDDNDCCGQALCKGADGGKTCQ